MPTILDVVAERGTDGGQDENACRVVVSAFVAWRCGVLIVSFPPFFLYTRREYHGAVCIYFPRNECCEGRCSASLALCSTAKSLSANLARGVHRL